MNDRFDALAALVCPKGKPKAEDAKPKAEDDGDDDDDNEEQEADKGTVLSTAVTTIEKLREENTQLRADKRRRQSCLLQVPMNMCTNIRWNVRWNIRWNLRWNLRSNL